jgi:hypothetical protein
MFAVLISDDAKQLIRRSLTAESGPSPGLMIHRQGPVGEVSRNASGEASWSIERRHPWAIAVGSYQTPDDEGIIVVDGIRVWLPLIPRPGEKGVSVSVREGQLYVEGIDV